MLSTTHRTGRSTCRRPAAISWSVRHTSSSARTLASCGGDALESLQPYKLRPSPNELPGRWMTGTQNHEGIAGVAAAVEYLAEIGTNLDPSPGYPLGASRPMGAAGQMGTSRGGEGERRSRLLRAFE